MKEKLAPLPPRPRMAVLDDKGREVVDSVPLAPPVGYVPGMTQEDRLRQMIRNEHNRLYALMYDESFEEANDLDIPDDPIDPSTPYEEHYDPMDAEIRYKLRDDEWRRTFEKRLQEEREKRGLNDGDTSRTDERRESNTGRRDGDEREVSGQREREDEKPPVQGGVSTRAQGDAPGAREGKSR